MIPGKIKIAVLTSVLFLVLVTGYLWHAGFLFRRGPMETLIIGTSLSNVTGMLLVAREKGYFMSQGLEVTFKIFSSGNLGLEQLQAGEIDFACFTEFAYVAGIFGGGEPLKCLGAIANADDIQLVARKDRGITEPGLIKGKKVGVFRGSITEFFLGRFLTFNGLALGDVEVVYLDLAAMAEALEDGRVDAVMVWEPAAIEILRKSEEKAVSWPGQGGQSYYWLLVSTDKVIHARASAVKRLFQGLTQAEKFIKTNKEESIDLVAGQVKLDPETLKNIWSKYLYELSLDQSLLITMEDQSRWMIQNRLMDRKQVPNFLDYLDPGALGQINPRALRLVLPGSGEGH